MYACMQVCKYASKQVCKYVWLHVCKYVGMQECKIANMHIYMYTLIKLCKHESMQVSHPFKYSLQWWFNHCYGYFLGFLYSTPDLFCMMDCHTWAPIVISTQIKDILFIFSSQFWFDKWCLMFPKFHLKSPKLSLFLGGGWSFYMMFFFILKASLN